VDRGPFTAGERAHRALVSNRTRPARQRFAAGTSQRPGRPISICSKSTYHFWNRRFRREPQLAGDAHRPVPRETNLDSVLSIRRSRTLDQDHTIRWEGVIYRLDRKQIASGTRGARVQVERRLDGNLWMHWRTQILPLEPSAAKAREPRESPSENPELHR
jgi:hypothetical protein